MSRHLITKIQADEILLSLHNLHTLEPFLRLYHCLLCMALCGWSACTELHYLIPQHEVSSWPGIPTMFLLSIFLHQYLNDFRNAMVTHTWHEMMDGLLEYSAGDRHSRMDQQL